jgi:peroxiredoxin
MGMTNRGDRFLVVEFWGQLRTDGVGLPQCNELENSLMTIIGSDAPDAVALAVDGTEVRFSDYWRKGTTAFTFIRYLSCIFCKEQVKEYRDHAAEIARAGLQVVIVTPATPEESAAFAERLNLPFPILCDPERAAYRAYGLTEGSAGQLLNPRVVARGIQATLHGSFPTPPKGGNPRQLPGTAIVDWSGKVQFHHVAEDASDHVTIAQLLAQAQSIGPARGATVEFS